MPADPADIPRALRAAQIVLRTDAAVREAFPSARDAVGTPDPGNFENASDAAAALAIKAALVGTFRRRFVVTLEEELAIDPASAIPTLTLTDSEHAFNGPVIPCRLQLDLETDSMTIEVIG